MYLQYKGNICNRAQYCGSELPEYMALILRNGGSQSPDRWLREPRNNQYIDRFVCYDINLKANDIVNDIEDFDTQLIINRNDQFASYDEQFKNTSYKSYQLIPSSSQIKSMEIIVLKEILTDILQAKIQ